jgi:hypothetical protein
MRSAKALFCLGKLVDVVCLRQYSKHQFDQNMEMALLTSGWSLAVHQPVKAVAL